VLQRLRLGSGLVLFTYVTTHLLNHALGLVSLGAAEAGRLWFIGFWRFPLSTALLYGSLVTHFSLVLWALYLRRHLRIPPWEIIRLSLGLLIPALLLQHVFGARVQHQMAGIDDTYTRLVLSFWVRNPSLAVQQITLLTVAWLHGCMGLYFWLRVKQWRRFTLPTLRLLGPLVPILAVLGFANMGQEVSVLAADPVWLAQATVPPPPEVAATVDSLRNGAYGLYVGSVLLVFAARRVRTALARRKGVICLSYPSGRQVLITPGTTVLEASRAAGIPHASLCGGRGRCSTCRTRIGDGVATLPEPSRDEARVLRRIGAPPNVRLACQLRPTADLEVFPLLPPLGGLPADPFRPSHAAGSEREIAILFADLRSFTHFAEHRLPYDVVFVLNQYFSAMGGAIERAGGHLDKFIGDGIMALFGLDSEPEKGCRDALVAALEMARALEQLNRTLRHDLKEPLRIGIGIHVGQVIVGEMGYGRARSLTAIGDAVNIASRLEVLTKEYASQAIVSDELATRASVDLSSFPRHEIEIRGRTRPLSIRVIGSGRELETVLSPKSKVGRVLSAEC
jgi:adenylate cyclase